MRRAIAILLALSVMVSLVGCGEKSNSSSINIKGPDGKETKIEVKGK